MNALALALPPPLREGDRLDSAEFLRRWEAMPGLRNAELIRGTVFLMPSPVSSVHSDAHTDMAEWLIGYRAATPGCHAGIDSTWKMGGADVPQPDLFLRILPEHGGQSHLDGPYFAGAPELIVEITQSTLSRDLGVKLQLYREAGVREYLSILLQTKQVIWRHLSRSRYRELEPEADGFLRSRTFPGLWLDPRAVWDPKRSIRSALDQGLRSPEHAAFVKRLAGKKRKR